MLAQDLAVNAELSIELDNAMESINAFNITHPTLDDMISRVRNESIPWENYQQADLITEDDLAMIRYAENKSPEEITSYMSEHGVYYAAMYMELMQRLARVDTLRKVLVLIHDMLDGHHERIFLFHKASANRSEYPFTPFHKALQINDEFIGIQSSKILALLICTSPKKDNDISSLFRWITFQLQSSQSHVIELNIQILACLFHISSYRLAFWSTLHAMDTLVSVLKQRSTNPQNLYNIIFAVWLLTFEREIATGIDRKYDVIAELIDIAKSAKKEKLIRIIVATFKNLVQRAPHANLPSMLVAKLLPFVEHLSARKWSDEEMTEDIDYIKSRLQEEFQSLTTFEIYTSELETGKLEWSPPHQSENFWRQNAEKLNEHDHRLLTMLTRHLSSNDSTTLSIACHDLGQYVKYSTKNAKRNLDEIGAKQRVMELMTHQDPNVRYHALCATQKYFAMTA